MRPGQTPTLTTTPLACSYDTTAATSATPSTASAVDHLSPVKSSPPKLRRRILDTAVAVLAAVAVSVAWVVTVALVPASSRPYIDGTTNNNPFSMVFGYNALTRFSSLGITPASVGAVSQQGGGAGAISGSGLATMFQGAQASQVGWLYPLAAVSIAVLLWQRRGKPRTDPIRAIVIMWTAWIAVYGPAGQTGQTSQTAESQIEAWVPAHCSKVPASDYGGTSTSSTSGTLYECTGS